MNPISEFFAHFCAAVWALLRGATVIHLRTELTPLKSDLLGDVSKLAEARI